jgi:hypothetical protein
VNRDGLARLPAVAVLDPADRRRAHDAALPQHGDSVAARWLAAGIPLTLLLDVTNPDPDNSFHLARHEAAQRRHLRLELAEPHQHAAPPSRHLTPA